MRFENTKHENEFKNCNFSRSKNMLHLLQNLPFTALKDWFFQAQIEMKRLVLKIGHRWLCNFSLEIV